MFKKLKFKPSNMISFQFVLLLNLCNQQIILELNFFIMKFFESK